MLYPPFRCANCDASLAVSETHCRIQVLLSMLGGFAIAWYAKVYTLLVVPILGDDCVGFIAWLCVIGCLAYPLLMVLVRVAPYLISVPLQMYCRSSVTTLDLNRERDMELEERDVLP